MVMGKIEYLLEKQKQSFNTSPYIKLAQNES